MKKFKLIDNFRDFFIGQVFTLYDNGQVGYIKDNGEEDHFNSDIFKTLLDVGGYLEEVTTNRWTPTNGENFYYITGSGEIKQKTWTGSDWCIGCRDTFGVFSTITKAQKVLVNLIESAQLYYETEDTNF